MSKDLYKEDQVFMNILTRADRKEMCEYRGYILEELRRREKREQTPITELTREEFFAMLEKRSPEEKRMLLRIAFLALFLVIDITGIIYGIYIKDVSGISIFSICALLMIYTIFLNVLQIHREQNAREMAKAFTEYGLQIADTVHEMNAEQLKEACEKDPELALKVAQAEVEQEIRRQLAETLKKDSAEMVESKRDAIDIALGFKAAI